MRRVRVLFCFIIFFIMIFFISFFFDQSEISPLNELLKLSENVTPENPILYTPLYQNQKEAKVEHHILVPVICQYPALPTGCESAAAAMVLQYYGLNISAENFAKEWLSCSFSFYHRDGKLYGPDPNRVFVGDPFLKSSYGCFADPIVNAINENQGELVAKKIVDQSLDSLCKEYISQDIPVLIWATMGMSEAKEGNRWYLEDGSLFTWTAGEHCLVLVGYNETHYYLNDPMTGKTTSYPKSLVEKRFEQLGCQAVLITKKD